MKATLLLRERLEFSDGAVIEMKIWRVPEPVWPSGHDLKYSLVYIVAGARVVGYDNERGKGDHRQYGPTEAIYRFVDAATLIADFKAEILALRGSL